MEKYGTVGEGNLCPDPDVSGRAVCGARPCKDGMGPLSMGWERCRPM